MSEATLPFALRLVILSLVCIGGANTIFPDIYRFVVVERGWLTAAHLGTLIGLSQAAPGPNMLVMALVGQAIGGIATAVIAMLAFTVPAGIVAWLVARLDVQSRDARWMRIGKAGLAPLTVGLVLASGLVLAQPVATSHLQIAIVAVTALLSAATKLNPLWFIGGAVLASLAG